MSMSRERAGGRRLTFEVFEGFGNVGLGLGAERPYLIRNVAVAGGDCWTQILHLVHFYFKREVNRTDAKRNKALDK